MPKSNSAPETGSPSIRRCFSGRCSPRGRTSSVAGSATSRYSLPSELDVLDRALDRVDEVDVAADLVGPGRGVGVLEVGHEAARAGVERVDHELAVGRAGDLDAPVAEVGGRLGDAPLALADLARLGAEVERAAAQQLRGALAPRRQQLAPARLEARVQLADEVERIAAEHLLQLLLARRRDLDAHGRVPLIEWSSKVIGW